MKRTSLSAKKSLFFLLIVYCFFASSCEREKYNPKQKIKEIYFEYPGFYPKHLSEVWTWDKNQLAKIDYYGGNSIINTEYYFYEKKKLIKVEDDENYFNIIYDGWKYKKIECYRKNGTLEVTYDFTYAGSKISKIVYTDYYNFILGKESGFLSKLLSKEFIQEMKKLSAQNSSAKEGTPYIYTFTYTYDGDNIKEKKVEYIDDQDDIFNMVYTYKSYDNNLNPFYKHVGLPYPYEFIGIDLVSPKNNPVEVFRERSEDYEREVTIKYTYSYEDQFPVEIQEENIYEDGSLISKYYYVYQ